MEGTTNLDAARGRRRSIARRVAAALALLTGSGVGVLAGALPASAAFGPEYSFSTATTLIESDGDAADLAGLQLTRVGLGSTPSLVRFVARPGGPLPAIVGVDAMPVDTLVTFPTDGPARLSIDLLTDLVKDGNRTMVLEALPTSGGAPLASFVLTIQDSLTPEGHPQARCDGRAATVIGNPGDDIIDGYYERDVIVGFGGNDRFVGIGPDDIVCGGMGDDVVEATGPIARTHEPRLLGGPGNDTITSTGLITGGDGNDVLTCEASGDAYCSLVGGRGHDRLTSQSLRPITILGGAGTDTILGTQVGDIISGGGPVADVAGGECGPQEVSGNDVITAGGGQVYSAEGTTSAQQLRAFGCDGNDTLTVTGHVDAWGGPGSDRIEARGNGARQRIYGGEGLDTIIAVGAFGPLYAYGDADPDTIDLSGTFPASGFTLYGFGGLGADRLIGGPSSDSLSGDEGWDTIEGRGGRDVLIGGTGGDTIDGGDGPDLVYGGEATYGSTSFGGTEDRDVLRGGAGDDEVYGHSGADKLYGDAGTDRLHGGDGEDRWNDPDGTTGPNATTLIEVEIAI